MKRVKLTLLALLLILCLVGCSKNQTSSRQLESSAIVSGDSTADISSSSVESTLQSVDSATVSSTESSDPSRIDDTLPIYISDKFTVLDHDKSTASVYKVNLNYPTKEWEGNDTWTRSYISLAWCYGRTYYSAPEEWPDDPSEMDNYITTCSSLSFSKAKNNILNFERSSVGKIPGVEKIPSSVIDLSSDESIFAYNMDLYDYPWDVEFSSTKKLKIPQATVYYISSCVDGIPCGITSESYSGQYGIGLTSSEYPTYEWEGVVKPAHYIAPDHILQYTNGETIIYLDDTIHKIKEILVDQGKIVPVEDCFESIPDAINYDMKRIAGVSYEVYSAELRYIRLREHPHAQMISSGERLIYKEDEEFILVPVWEFSILVKRVDALKEDSSKAKTSDMYRYTVYINALTGESMYSKTHGPADEEYYPFLYGHDI